MSPSTSIFTFFRLSPDMLDEGALRLEYRGEHYLEFASSATMDLVVSSPDPTLSGYETMDLGEMREKGAEFDCAVASEVVECVTSDLSLLTAGQLNVWHFFYQ